jgi:NAD+ kinase
MKIGVVSNPEKGGVKEGVERILRWGEGKGIELLLDEPSSSSIGVGCWFGRGDIGDLSDLVVVLGGDGTILSIVEEIGAKGVPILGVNLGRKGFLAEIEVEELEEYLDMVLNGDHVVEERMMLRAEVMGSKGSAVLALNDVVVAGKVVGKINRFSAYVDGEAITTYWADGIIVSTPTGSTAYSLSAGGPIVHPRVHSIILTPICPHTLSNRAIVLPAESEVLIKADGKRASMNADGRGEILLEPGDMVRVVKFDRPFRLIISKGGYFDLLRKKLNWGVDSL